MNDFQEKYLALLKDGVLDNPQTLMWTSPNNLSTHNAPSFGKHSMCCLPCSWQLSQKVNSSYLSMLIFSTRFFLTKVSHSPCLVDPSTHATIGHYSIA